MDEEKILSSMGISDATPLRKVDVRLWLAIARLKDGTPRDQTNVRLLSEGRLAFTELSLAREAACARNTIASNRDRLATLLEALSDAEDRRRTVRREAEAGERAERRDSRAKDLIIEQQASLIAQMQVALHGMTRRIAAMSARAGAAPGAGLSLSARRPARANGRPDRGASR
ncbi:hypothetical protein H5J25_04010 [Sphingomonas aliaeris]|uniref:Uncharacterized protein n=1 Tax=Sphingomonas aliaeris TaxID=2759526 RepID=A0A974S4S0_9SPHN|nr:hypothetical protein [Sphingomonas aliaeris]QQV77923.1 hypothetical protein H5J25_04010 [Sphingomonas aliaeris]